MAGFALQTEAANPHADPLIQASESVKHLSHTKIVGISSDDRVKVLEDSLDIPPLLPPGHVSDTVFELLNGTLSDAKAEAAKVKPQELKSLVEIRKGKMRRKMGTQKNGDATHFLLKAEIVASKIARC